MTSQSEQYFVFPPAVPSPEEELTTQQDNVNIDNNSKNDIGETDSETTTTVATRRRLPVRNLSPGFKPGEFMYVPIDSRKMLATAYKAIDLLELWYFISEDPGENGFMFCQDKRVTLIFEKIEELGYTDHSGFSIAFTLRAMQFIAKNGEEQYRLQQYNKN